MLQKEFNLLDKFIRYLRLIKIVPYLGLDRVVCDLGSGDGIVLKSISKKIREGYGVDKEVPKFKEENLHYIRADITQPLPFENEKFDIVLFLAVLEHLELSNIILSEVWRILKYGGKFILTTPAPQSRWLLEFLAFKLKNNFLG